MKRYDRSSPLSLPPPPARNDGLEAAILAALILFLGGLVGAAVLGLLVESVPWRLVGAIILFFPLLPLYIFAWQTWREMMLGHRARVRPLQAAIYRTEQALRLDIDGDGIVGNPWTADVDPLEDMRYILQEIFFNDRPISSHSWRGEQLPSGHTITGNDEWSKLVIEPLLSAGVVKMTGFTDDGRRKLALAVEDYTTASQLVGLVGLVGRPIKDTPTRQWGRGE